MPNARRRPARRRAGRNGVTMPPMAVAWAAPTINGPNTIWETGVNQAFARIASVAATPDVTQITLTGIIDGVYTVAPALEIGDEGESPEGSRFQVTWVGILNLAMPWEIAIPSDTPLIQSRFGGRIAGTYGVNDPPGTEPYGWCRISSTSQIADTAPYARTPVVATANGTPTISVVWNDGSAFDWPTTTPPWTITGGATWVSSAPAGGGHLDVTYSININAGEQLQQLSYDGGFRTADGQWSNPFQILTTV